MKFSQIKYWAGLIAAYLTGQGFIRFVELATALLIIRFLSVQEFALYTLFNTFQAIGCAGTDLGISQGVVSYGAGIRDDRNKLWSLVDTAQKYRRQLFIFVSVGLIIAAPFFGKVYSPQDIVICLIAVLTASWFQQNASLRAAVLYVHHNAKELLIAGTCVAFLRLVCVYFASQAYPSAAVILIINAVGLALSNFVLTFRSQKYFNEPGTKDSSYQKPLLDFIKPLIPSTIYSLIQGQIAILFLSSAAQTVAVAEMGALMRFGQVIAFLGLINTFFIHPYFARIHVRKDFVKKASLFLICFIAGIMGIIGLASLFPMALLFMIGPKYYHLKSELLMVLATAGLILLTSMQYYLLLARKETKGQVKVVLGGIIVQVLWVGFVGVHSLEDALWFNFISAASFFILQGIVITKMLLEWPSKCLKTTSEVR